MKAILFTGSRGLTNVQLPDPTAGPGEVVIRMRASGVCGSDLHRFRQTAEQLGEMTKVVPGHDSCGDIVEVGEGVSDRSVGQRVVGYLKVGCMKCKYCLAGIPAHCPFLRSIGRQINGSDGEYIVIPSTAALPIPDWVSYQEGAILSCNFGTGYSAVMRARPTLSPTHTLVVFGVGPVGLSAVMTSSRLGYRTVAVDLSETRLKMASRLGAEHTINARAVDVIAAIKDLTDGEGFDTAIECSGTAAAQIQTMQAGGPMSKSVLVGNGSARADAPLGVFKAKEMQMEGSVVFRLTEYEGMLSFIEKADFSLSDLIETELPIEEAAEAFARAEKGDSGKVLFSW
jgi:threonine dehydrogenase-like Zn-dependent dehydrogenase